MQARQLRALGGLGGAGAVLLILWAVSSQPPRLPADADHGVQQPEASCLFCHGVAGQRPRPARHPRRDDCYSCHRDAAGRLHPRRDAPTELPGGWRDTLGAGR